MHRIISRRSGPDIVVIVNGIPVDVIELKNPADENATIWSAFNRLMIHTPLSNQHRINRLR